MDFVSYLVLVLCFEWVIGVLVLRGIGELKFIGVLDLLYGRISEVLL